MPAITVLTVTGRDLYRKENVELLKTQTFKDFDWVLVDDLFTDTWTKMLEYVGTDSKLSFTHIQPKNPVKTFSPGASVNDGLVRCSGELVVFKADYMMMHPTCLQRLWDTHKKYPKAMLSGRCIELGCHPSELLESKGVFAGRDYRMSLFINQLFKWSYMNENLYGIDRDGVQNWWGGKNDAAPLEALLEVNGMDEQYDGHYGYHDDDLANRLMTYGLSYVFDTTALAFECPHSKHSKDSTRETNQHFKDKLIPQRIREGIYRANPNRDLRKELECLTRLSV